MVTVKSSNADMHLSCRDVCLSKVAWTTTDSVKQGSSHDRNILNTYLSVQFVFSTRLLAL